ncbi:GNAT family N-acetyltransferase [Paenibacillus sp. OSY-SE]|uniref:GNAT family N-acetyltransferase n=1 Tax=Paenibacillus sp. OSY-SE TaxID=1196323 RepID=UPI00031FDBE0|nr:GNAT family N-acetyltransferase [Paenibacillus sp. OSY-SE]
MWISCSPNDPVLIRRPFTDNEVEYQLLHRICGSQDCSIRMRTEKGDAVFAQTARQHAWLWVSEEATLEQKQSLIMALCELTSDKDIPGISAHPEVAELFAQMYTDMVGGSYKLQMDLQSYACEHVTAPANVQGTMRRAAPEHVNTISGFVTDFIAEAMGTAVPRSDQVPFVERSIASGDMMVWTREEEPVAMARIAHRSPRHARINSVYTAPEHRKKGYASALVAELCDIVQQEKLIPILYADMVNPDSNNVYRKIGFTERGIIRELAFQQS